MSAPIPPRRARIPRRYQHVAAGQDDPTGTYVAVGLQPSGDPPLGYDLMIVIGDDVRLLPGAARTEIETMYWLLHEALTKARAAEAAQAERRDAPCIVV